MQFPLVRMRTRHNNIAIVKIFLYLFGWILILNNKVSLSRPRYWLLPTFVDDVLRNWFFDQSRQSLLLIGYASTLIKKWVNIRVFGAIWGGFFLRRQVYVVICILRSTVWTRPGFLAVCSRPKSSIKTMDGYNNYWSIPGHPRPRQRIWPRGRNWLWCLSPITSSLSSCFGTLYTHNIPLIIGSIELKTAQDTPREWT